MADVDLPELLSEESLERHKACAEEVGVRLIARASAGAPVTGDPKRDFLDDHQRFMNEINTDFRVRTIGGAPLDLYGLYKAVLERGGLQTVISTRAFKMVGRALQLPRSCTSAAFILRVEYEKLLYMYEQKHVWNREPTAVAQLHPADKNVRVASAVMRAAHAPVHVPGGIAATAGAAYGFHSPQAPMAYSRPKRQAALAASSAVAAAVSDDPYNYPVWPRRTRNGLDESSLTGHDEQLVEEEIVNDNVPHSLYVPGQPGERDRVVSALWSPVREDVAWALGTLNALSFDMRNLFLAQEFPGILDALHEILSRHLEDVLCKRSYGVGAGLEEEDENAPRDVPMPAVDIRVNGHALTGAGVGVTHQAKHQETVRSSSLQQYAGLFNLVDPVAVDREQCAVVAVNVLRNMSFYDRNAIFLSNERQIIELSGEMIQTASVPANLRDGLMDMWINVSPYMNVSDGEAGSIVLTSCIKLLDPFLEGADFSRFTNCGEVLARLAASPERNEVAIVSKFDDLLPRLVDMLGGRDRRYVNAGLAALCNCSAFDWSARSSMARVPRALSRLVNMLSDPELAPRAALTLLNLAEAPNNRGVMMSFESQLLESAMVPTPAADTVASVLFQLSND